MEYSALTIGKAFMNEFLCSGQGLPSDPLIYSSNKFEVSSFYPLFYREETESQTVKNITKEATKL